MPSQQQQGSTNAGVLGFANRRSLFFSYSTKIKGSSQEFCENRLRIITGRGDVLGFLHLLVGNFKNESRLGLFLRHKHVAFRRNFPSGANVHCPLIGLDEGLRNPNGTAFRV
jgi:hypothetical protein